MKRLLATLLLLSIPALASADSVSWSTYCDGGVEKARCTLVFEMGGGVTIGTVGPLSAFNNEQCDTDGPGAASSSNAIVEDLGDGDFRMTWQGWLRSYLTVNRPAFSGQFFFNIQEGSDPPHRLLQEFSCQNFGENYSIVDNVDCSPLPVAASTWGAVKAMYR